MGTKWWPRLTISLGLMALLIYFFVDVEQLRLAWQRCRWDYLGWLILWLTLDRLVMSGKWRLLLTCRGLAIGHWEVIRSYYLATFAGLFLPVTVGADALRVAAVATPLRPSAVLAASVVMERALGFLAAALAALASLLLLTQLTTSLSPGYLLWSLSLLAGGAVLLLASLWGPAQRPLARLADKLGQKGRLGRWLAKFLTAYQGYGGHGGVLAGFTALSLLEQVFPIGVNWLAAQGLGLNLSLTAAAAVTPVAILFARLPVSAGSFGVVEGLYMAFFSLVGLNSSDAFLLGLVFNLAVLVSALPGLAFYLKAPRRPTP